MHPLSSRSSPQGATFAAFSEGCETLKLPKHLPCLTQPSTGILYKCNATRVRHLRHILAAMPASCIIAGRAGVAIRYRDAGWMWRLVRQSIRVVPPSNRALPKCQIPSLDYGRYHWICRFLPLPPKWTVRIVVSSCAKERKKSWSCK